MTKKFEVTNETNNAYELDKPASVYGMPYIYGGQYETRISARGGVLTEPRVLKEARVDCGARVCGNEVS